MAKKQMTVSQQRENAMLAKTKAAIQEADKERLNEAGIDLYDHVRNKVSRVSGVVNAVYAIDGAPTIDVHLDSSEVGRNIWYGSPLSNWELVRKNSDWTVTIP